jgi:putative redox protein
MSFTASARPLEGGLRHEIDVNGRHTITTDEPVALGGTDAGPAPHELLAAMVAGCVSTTIALYAARHDWPLAGLRVDCEYDPQISPRPLSLAIHLPNGLSASQVERLRRAADTCPVRRALEAGFTIEEVVETEAARAAA